MWWLLSSDNRDHQSQHWRYFLVVTARSWIVLVSAKHLLMYSIVPITKNVPSEMSIVQKLRQFGLRATLRQ